VAQTGAGTAGAAGDPARFAEAHRQLLQDGSIQFEMKPFQLPEVPAWLRWLGEALEGGGPVFQLIFWILVAAAAAALLYWGARWIEGGGLDRFRRRGPAAEGEGDEGWRPQEAPARALLSEADSLAAAGRYAEAAHLLLFRSIEDIDRRRPEVVRPALTSRDIADAPQLPSGPRHAFSRIVMTVERSLFGGRAIGETDWAGCRAAYEDFAFAPEWRR
jgi:hypothetical protein